MLISIVSWYSCGNVGWYLSFYFFTCAVDLEIEVATNNNTTTGGGGRMVNE
jgi:hypothetical protein